MASHKPKATSDELTLSPTDSIPSAINAKEWPMTPARHLATASNKLTAMPRSEERTPFRTPSGRLYTGAAIYPVFMGADRLAGMQPHTDSGYRNAGACFRGLLCHYGKGNARQEVEGPLTFRP